MSTLAQVKPEKPFSSSTEDEKYEGNEKILSTFDDRSKLANLTSSEIGEVFAEGPRLIDLGDDGKERPIGVSMHFIYASNRIDNTYPYL